MRTAIVVMLAFVALRPIAAQSSCSPEGVWRLVSGSVDGAAYPTTLRAMKVITKRHFLVVGEDARGVKEMKTAADSLQAFRTMGTAGGRYTLQGNSYTEHLDYYSDPAYLGVSMSFTCRVEGNRLFQSGAVPVLEGGRKVREVKLEEVWRRIE